MSNDWRELTESESNLVQSCGRDEICLLYNDELIKLTVARMMEWQGAAFRVALLHACELAGISPFDEPFDYTVDQMDADKPYMRVTVTAADGRQVSAIGMLPNPRVH